MKPKNCRLVRQNDLGILGTEKMWKNNQSEITIFEPVE